MSSPSSFSIPTDTAAPAGTGTNLAVIEHQLRSAKVLERVHPMLTRVGSALGDAAYAQLSRILQEFLNVDAGPVMLAGWRKYRELREAGMQTLTTVDSVVVDLAGRDLSLVRSPCVKVMVGNEEVASLAFEVRVLVVVIAVAATVRNGALVALTGGRCDVTASVSYDGQVLATHPWSLDPRLAVPLETPLQLVTPLRPSSSEASPACP